MPQRVSLCLIVKNEEAHLRGSIGTAADLVDEIVVVDTGSTDRTKEIAASYGARIFDFPWVNHFAAARNEGLRHATGDWIFWLDGDDTIDEENRARLRQQFAGLGTDNIAYMMKCLCVANAATNTEARVLEHVRLFRNDPAIRWQYRVHEQILPAILAQKGRIEWTDVIIKHMGYQDPAQCGDKRLRNLRLLQQEEKELPEDPIVLFNIAWTYLGLERPADALPYLERSLGRVQPDANFINKLYALISKVHAWLGRRDMALEVSRQGLARFPQDAELLFQHATLSSEQGDLASAEQCLLKLLQMKVGGEFGSFDPEVHGCKSRHMLGAIYHNQGRLPQAEEQWRAVVADRPDHTGAWLGLGDVWLAQGRRAELEQVIRQFEADPRREADVAVLRGLICLSSRDFTGARTVLESACARHPRVLWPRILLGEVLMREGRDMAAAERVLREVLALDPSHTQTRRSLENLLRQQGKAVEPAAGAKPAYQPISCKLVVSGR